MREVTDIAAELLKESHQIYSTIEVYYDGEATADEIPIIEGSMEGDSTADVWWNISFSVPRVIEKPGGTGAWDLAPTHPDSPLGSDGQQIFLTYHIVLIGTDEERLGLGWYRIQEWTLSEDQSEISLTCASLDMLLSEARLLWLYNAKRTTFIEATTDLVADLLPMEITAADRSLNRKEPFEEDRLGALRTLEKSWPAVMHVDDNGVWVVSEPVDDATDPIVFHLVDGEGGTIVRIPTNGTREGIYNAVKVTSEDSDSGKKPLYGIAYLGEGPRRWNGPYGNVPYFQNLPNLKTKDAANKAARTRLQRLQVLAEPITVDCAPDPRYEIGDVGRITMAYRLATTSGAVNQQVDVLFRIDQITLPLHAEGGSMRLVGHRLPDRSSLGKGHPDDHQWV